MKRALTIIYFISATFACADETSEKTLASMKRGDTTFNYVRIIRGEQSEWELRVLPKGDILLKLSSEKDKGISSMYTYSNLIDVVHEGDQVGVLLSVDVGLLYIRCAREADGYWKESWRQRIIGATGPQAKTTLIKLKKIDTITIESKEGNDSEFVLSKEEVKKDGSTYEPDRGFLLGGGAPAKSE